MVFGDTGEHGQAAPRVVLAVKWFELENVIVLLRIMMAKCALELNKRVMLVMNSSAQVTIIFCSLVFRTCILPNIVVDANLVSSNLSSNRYCSDFKSCIQMKWRNSQNSKDFLLSRQDVIESNYYDSYFYYCARNTFLYSLQGQRNCLKRGGG